MPTALSSTDRLRSTCAEGRRATGDVVPLLRFRAAGLRGRSRRGAGTALVLIGLLTVLAGRLPAHVPGAAGNGGQSVVEAGDVLLLLPTAYLGVLLISIVSVAASGGGRELLSREQAVAYPVSPATDHLGALLMAPLNVAWLVQAWMVLGSTAFVVGPQRLLAAQLPLLVWLLVATALAQLVGWALEWVRRGARGRWLVRLLGGLVVGGLAVLVATDTLVPVLDRSPTRLVVHGVLSGSTGAWSDWFGVVGALGLVGIAAVVAGAALAQAVARRPAREELRVESSVHAPRANPASDFVALLRTDRVSVWRSVPLRRGIAVLGALPGLVALGGALDWSTVTILPGMVASGGALLFGVNAWCLDGRGALWRDSLPVAARPAFVSRVVVLVEVLLLSSLVTLVLASLRAGVPTVSEVVAVLCATFVVSVQVVGSAMRWSVRRPFAVDMRSARATPAPPLVMVGYSTKLALSTTCTALLFSALATFPEWQWSLLAAVPFLLFSARKLVATANEWSSPGLRSRVVATVAS